MLNLRLGRIDKDGSASVRIVSTLKASSLRSTKEERTPKDPEKEATS